MKKRSLIQKISILLIFLILLFLIILINDKNNNQTKYDNSNLYITEIVSNNKTIIKDSDNEYSDYVEIYNDGDKEINLSGYYLSDESTSSKKWVFPKIIIKPKEYLIIYASNKDKCDLSIRECHTNFKLDKNGETVTLLDNNGVVLSKVKYPESNQNTSYSLIENTYKFVIATPNAENIDLKKETNKDSEIIINEVTTSTEEEAIELKNITDKDIDLSKYYIKDKSNIVYQFENTTIKANSYLVIYGSDKPSIINNKIYTGFKINNNNEILYLYKNNTLVDTFNVGKCNHNTSKGRNELLEIVTYKDITLGKENSKKYYLGFTETPTFSINGGYVEKGTNVEISSCIDCIVYYTLDGSIPNTKSKKYKKPITINKNTVIKTIVYKEGYIESDIESRTFLVGRKHELPVVSISTTSSNLFGTKGIFTFGPNASSKYPYYGANFWSGTEVPISLEYYENGILGLELNAGMKIFGGWSRGEAQKSLSLYFREKYGVNEITYPFFENNITTFKRLVLRNSGQDYGKTKIKDAFLHEVLEGQMDIDKQGHLPVVVYINGEYWGLYNLREKTDDEYIETHYGYTEDELSFIQNKTELIEGSMKNYQKLLDYVKNNDMTTDEAYEYIDSQIDLQELINYWVTETYYGQQDPANIKYYQGADGKWRWILYDLDQTFMDSTIRWELPFSNQVPGHGYTIDTTLMNNIIKNPKIRLMYIETFAYHLKNTFNPERMIKILDEMTKEIEPEMPYHINRWYQESIRTSQYTILSMNHWQNNLTTLKNNIKGRYQNAIKTAKKGLGLTQEEYDKYFKDLWGIIWN